MISRNDHLDPEVDDRQHWRHALVDAVRDVGELLELVGVDPADLPQALHSPLTFPLRVPRSFVRRMRAGDPRDPLLLQVLPTADESKGHPGYTPDPVSDGASSPCPGVLHKYRGRALLIVTGACAVHCRYCFRREFPYPEHSPAQNQALEWLRGSEDVDEILLSGGDPLSWSNRKLGELLHTLATIPHLRRVRVHTRTPIVLPERVDDGLVEILKACPLPTVLVVHANHGQEIDDQVAAALHRLRVAGTTLLNQSVLLRGVNDEVAALRNLSERLFEAGVLPYYLHLLDRVTGTAHFDVPEDRARALLWDLAAELPGYLVPRLVREIAGAPAKTPIPWGPLAGLPPQSGS